jgi:serine/threonine protein kinase
MALVPGARIGHYEILGQLGAGGMGEVYRARDTRLDRDVAIKVLPAALARHPDRLARFEREAKTLAALNHPHIAVIYGLEQGAIAMELVEGPTLADRLKAGPLALQETLAIARQIADALEAAHDKGIVHRDIKPANVKAPSDAPVKVLDFGLATAVQAPRESSDPANSPTLTMGATEAGVILGTAAYMSPEQASGKPVDKRADIWSFGVVLWEMLTGKRLFQGGETVSHTLADVLRKEIDFEQLPAATPPAIETLVRRCLDRDARTRLRDIGEARVAMDRAAASPGESGHRPAKARSPLAWIAAAAVLALALSGVSFVHFLEAPPLKHRIQFQINPPSGRLVDLKLSPDGRFLAMLVRDSASEAKIWLRALDGLEARSLATVPGPSSSLFWSADAAHLAFDSQGKLYKIARTGGPPVFLSTLSGTLSGGAWRDDSLLLYSTRGGIYRVAASGGATARVDTAGESSAFPVWLEGRRFLYATPNGIVGASLDGTKPKRILADVSPIAYVPAQTSGSEAHVLFVRGETLMAQPLDAESMEPRGDAVPLAENVGRGSGFTASASGVLVYERGANQNRELVWLDRSGKRLQTVSRPFVVANNPAIRLSPDDTRAIVPVAGENGVDLWIADLNRNTLSRLTLDGSIAGIWAPDGRKVLWAARDGSRYLKSADGSGADELLFKHPGSGYPYDWSPSGKIAFTVMGLKTAYDIWLVEAEGGRKPYPYAESRFAEYWAQVSADGRWMAYVSEHSGRPEVLVESIPAGKGRWPVSSDGGSFPVWRPGGKEIFFSRRNQIMAAPVRVTETAVEVGKPQVLFELPSVAMEPDLRFQVSRDGQRFLLAVPVDQGATARTLTVDTDWRAGLMY